MSKFITVKDAYGNLLLKCTVMGSDVPVEYLTSAQYDHLVQAGYVVNPA